MVPPIFYAVVEGAKGALQRWGTATLETEERGRCGEMAVIGR